MDEISSLIIKMTEFFNNDPKRIQHFIKVYTFARVIGRAEQLDINSMYCLDTAAVVHDIGIKPAEEKYGAGHCGGKLQEELGPEPARKMLTELGYDEGVIDRVCFLIAHHHTYTGVDGDDWQILLEADFMVNAFEDNLSKESIINFRDKIFITNTGTKMLNDMFGLE
ncbi:HD domain-containing protein [uncultured Ruminococcus sp.]|uniref:HD domain-containing protein n=1 Tax=uncultured Ruminococcus sp. TaxID=165186 RepID=UPI0025FB53FA|nr:HD domain-containing protein [uncultured Ruminococcus sp.]